MEPEVEQIGDVTVVTMGMESLDASNSEEFGESLLAVIEGKTKIVFDMDAVRFVDSSGLKIFLMCLKRVRETGGDLKLCEMAKPVRELFELVRLHRMMDICDTRDAAVKGF